MSKTIEIASRDVLWSKLGLMSSQENRLAPAYEVSPVCELSISKGDAHASYLMGIRSNYCVWAAMITYFVLDHRSRDAESGYKVAVLSHGRQRIVRKQGKRMTSNLCIKMRLQFQPVDVEFVVGVKPTSRPNNGPP